MVDYICRLWVSVIVCLNLESINMLKQSQLKYIVCNTPSEYIRCTQFAGDHPYCLDHAFDESDFYELDDSTYWVRTSDYKTKD